jgi:hypothetical protein
MNKTAVFDPNTGKLLIKAGPVVLKLVARPGRIVSSEDILLKQEQLYEGGLIIIMGLPNATSVAITKSGTYVCGEQVVQQKLRRQGLGTTSCAEP